MTSCVSINNQQNIEPIQIIVENSETEENIIVSAEVEDTLSLEVLESDNDEQAYLLFAPLMLDDTYLMDLNGELIHTWEGIGKPGNSVYLLENGNLLHTSNIRSTIFGGGGTGGSVEEYNWEGEIVWSFTYDEPNAFLHHDVEMLPNGNILMIAWVLKSDSEAISAGFSVEQLPIDSEGLRFDMIIEIDPATNQIVWEWFSWDHLIQDKDESKDNYGNLVENPGLININYAKNNKSNDLHHINGIDYNLDLDQIILSSRNFSEFWIIDHSIDTVEAKGEAGDLLFRWGNPETYGGGTAGNRILYGQHNVQWIDKGLSGEGNILIFNNGDKRLKPYSEIIEIKTSMQNDGDYADPSLVDIVWSYQAEEPADFFADHISGVQRLENGHTLICEGTTGRFFEVTQEGEIIWETINPLYGENKQGLSNEVFRVVRYEADYLGFYEKDLSPKGSLAEIYR